MRRAKFIIPDKPLTGSPLFLFDRKINIKPPAFVQLTRRRNKAMVILHNFFDDCESNASAFTRRHPMQSLKYFKDGVFVFRRIQYHYKLSVYDNKTCAGQN